MTHEVLGIIWFVLVGVLLAGYAVFDGFDLGVGTLLPFLGKSAEDKEVMRRSVGPVWDGNEVWLLTGGGALFAAFPAVYATVFSGFYLALMLVLFALIFRAVSFEFHAHDPAWGGVWDWAFTIGSALPSLLFGVAVGNIALGVPLATDGEFAGNFFTLLGIHNGFNPFQLVIGVLGLSMILVQGASWLAVKSEGDLYKRTVAMRSTLAWAFTALVVVATAVTALFAKNVFANVTGSIVGWVFVALLVVSIAWGRLSMNGGKDLSAWYAISLSAVSLVGIWAASIFPNLVPSLGPGAPLTIASTMSSQLTLTVMLIIAAIGVPLVLFYIFLVYRVFAGKVRLDSEGY
ncbi:MAG: cytochrome d ubiquinol oxidase subunit II [Coriobacteriia bacterium]|nr:cytochrome d ubiquinol oxidase subunit II [Coriobacteriia bacterium]